MIKLLLLQLATIGILDFLNPVLAVFAPFITQFIKNQLKLTGNGALLLTLVISVGLAIFGAWATGAFVVGTSAFFLFTSIFTASTVIYKMLIKNDSVQAVLPESLK
jgi:hypothetical protein